MNIYEIKTRTAETSPHFFDRKTLKFFGQTMRSFNVLKLPDGKYLISAPIWAGGKYLGETVRAFNPETNRLEICAKEQKAAIFNEV